MLCGSAFGGQQRGVWAAVVYFVFFKSTSSALRRQQACCVEHLVRLNVAKGCSLHANQVGIRVERYVYARRDSLEKVRSEAASAAEECNGN